MSEERTAPAWRPLNRTQRRILGVLIEKAKTTPDQYPLSLNALVNGCNQKSNRSPQMNLQEHQVEEALVRLRAESVVGEVQGSGRVPKFRHYAKEWMDVTGAEMAVMAELLLRGDQAIGELRGRANRMTSNEISDVAALRPILDSLIQKKLVVPLTPPGRGQVVTHALYHDDEMAALVQKYGNAEQTSRAVPPEAPRAPTSPAPTPPIAGTSWTAEDSGEQVSQPVRQADTARSGDLSHEVRQLREEMVRLKKEIEDIWANLR